MYHPAISIGAMSRMDATVHVPTGLSKAISTAGFAGLARCRVEILAVGVEEGGEATDKGCADLVGAESVRADEADGRNASSVNCGCAGCKLLVKGI